MWSRRAAASPPLSDANHVLMVMLLTAQRCGEVCRMRWQDVDLERGGWMIPAEASKNADPHRVPLTAGVVAILKRRQARGDDVYVSPTTDHTCVAARAKKAAAELCSRASLFSFAPMTSAAPQRRTWGRRGSNGSTSRRC